MERFVALVLIAWPLLSPSVAWSVPTATSTAFVMPWAGRPCNGLSPTIISLGSPNGGLITTPLLGRPGTESGLRRRYFPLLAGRYGERDTSNQLVAVDGEKNVTCGDGFVDGAEKRQFRQTRTCEHHQGGQELDALLLDAAAVAALAVAVVSCLVPSSDAAAATTTASVEFVAQASATLDVGAIFAKAGRASFSGGVSGAAAAVVQVLSLMWLRTAMNFQVRSPLS